MIKQDLRDTSFLLYTRIDSQDRLTNLQLIIRHIQKYFNTFIIIWEMDIESKIPNKIKNSKDLNYYFLEDSNPILYTTKYRNSMVSQCETSYFFICDTDVIATPQVLVQCVEFLRKVNKKTLVYPYNGDFYNVPKDIIEIYSKTGDYQFLRDNEKMYKLWFQYSTGGIFGGRARDFQECGPDNENIFGWGPDDKERYYRLKKEGFAIKRGNAPLYHLNHDRKRNSRPADEKIRKKNHNIYMDTFS